MDKLKENTLKIHLEEFPTYEELSNELTDVLEKLDEHLIGEGQLGSVKDVQGFTKRYGLYKNTLTAVSGLDRYLQQRIEDSVAGYVLNFVDEPVYSLSYWDPESLVEYIVPVVTTPEDISDRLVTLTDKKVDIWGLREGYIRAQNILEPEQVDEFISEYCDIVCDEVLMYTVETMLSEALQKGELDITGIGRFGVNIDRFQQLLYSSLKDFDNMDDLRRHLIQHKETYTQIGMDSEDF